MHLDIREYKITLNGKKNRKITARLHYGLNTEMLIYLQNFSYLFFTLPLLFDQIHFFLFYSNIVWVRFPVDLISLCNRKFINNGAFF